MLVKIDGRVLKKLREEKHVTQEVLGELIQHSRQAIANIENGTTKNTDDKNLYALAKFFNVSPMELQGYQNTPREQTLEEEKQALSDFVFRVIQGELRETDMNTLFSIANFFGIDREHAQKIIDNQNCKITVLDKTKTVLKSPFTQGNYREQILSKINLLSQSKLPALGRILDYINKCDVDQLHQIEKLCEIISSYTPLDVSSNKNISDYIYHQITEYETPLFWEKARKDISRQNFGINQKLKKELKPIIDNDMGNLCFQTLLQFRKLLKKWSRECNKHNE